MPGKMACAPCPRRYNRRGTYRYLFVLDDRQSAVHFLFLRFHHRRGGKHGCCRKETAAGGVYLFGSYSLCRFVGCRLIRFLPAVFQPKRIVFACVYTIHARYATAVIDAMVLVVDAGSLASTGTQTAILAFLRINHWTEQRETGEKSQYRSHRTNRVAVSTPVPPCKNNQHDERNGGNKECRQTFQPDLRFIKGIAVRTLGKVGKQVVSPPVHRSKQVGGDTPVGAVRSQQGHERTDTGYQCNDEQS